MTPASASRITSYNVCYTKLLRIFLPLLIERLVKSARGEEGASMAAGGVAAFPAKARLGGSRGRSAAGEQVL